MRIAFCLAALIAMLPTPVLGQRVVGSIVDPQTGAGVAGAFIRLYEDGRLVLGVLSDSTGRFILTSPRAGRFSLRAERIGHATVEEGPFELAPGADHSVRLESPSTAIELEGLRATGGKRCFVRPERAAGAARVWAEARKALEITLWARDNAVIEFSSTRYVRETDRMGQRVTRQHAQQLLGAGHRAFNTPEPQFLVEHGFAATDGDSIEYYGPDAEVLLSDAFLDNHCFELIESRDDEQLVGLSFRPLPTRNLPEIRGTLWIERQTGMLRWLDYEFIQIDHLLPLGSVRRPLAHEPQHPEPSVRGRNEFRLLPSGVWVVDRWWIRTPRLINSRGRIELEGWREEGGIVLHAREVVGALFRVSGRS